MRTHCIQIRPARLAAVGALLLGSSAAVAQPAKDDPVAAQALFKAARELVEKGDYAAGCPKFEASLALHPSASTLINIARCHEHDGKLASAWDAYQRALTVNVETTGTARRKGLEDLANKGIAALEPRLPRLRIVIADPPAGLRVTRDGAEIPSAALAEALPADPGPHEIEASAPGRETVKKSVTLEEGKTATAEITLAPSPAGAKDEAPTERSPGVPIWAWIAAAGGLAASGAAVYFLVDDLAAIDALQSPEHCGPLAGGGYACDPRYDFAADNARKNLDFPLFVALGSAGVIALGAGIAGIVHGVTSKKPAPPAAAVWIAPGAAGAVWTGRF